MATKAGSGRPDPKVRMGRKMQVLENTPGNPFFKNFKEGMTFEEYKKLMKRIEESNGKFMK